MDDEGDHARAIGVAKLGGQTGDLRHRAVGAHPLSVVFLSFSASFFALLNEFKGERRHADFAN
jgi:hypothetical protein